MIGVHGDVEAAAVGIGINANCVGALRAVGVGALSAIVRVRAINCFHWRYRCWRRLCSFLSELGWICCCVAVRFGAISSIEAGAVGFGAFGVAAIGMRSVGVGAIGSVGLGGDGVQAWGTVAVEVVAVEVIASEARAVGVCSCWGRRDWFHWQRSCGCYSRLHCWFHWR